VLFFEDIKSAACFLNRSFAKKDTRHLWRFDMEQEGTQYAPGVSPRERHEGVPSQEELRDTAGAVAGAVKDEYRDVRGQVSRQAREAAESVRETARSYGEHQREAVGANIEAIVTALEAGVHSLEEQGRDTAAAYGRQAAAGVEDLAAWIREKSLPEVWQEAETYARRQPAVAFGGAVAAGFLLARFLKSSAPAETPRRPGGYAPESEIASHTDPEVASTEVTGGSDPGTRGG
jgi:hypothetical protein